MAERTLSYGFDPRALAVVDGLGAYSEAGPHYSRRTPGSRGFTGVGQEIVLLLDDGTAVWAVVRAKVPAIRGAKERRAQGEVEVPSRYLWRNMLFRNLGDHLSSDLIRKAVKKTYIEWYRRYGELPPERLRTEIDIKRVKSSNPGFCYLKAGWKKDRIVRGKLYLYAPPIEESLAEPD